MRVASRSRFASVGRRAACGLLGASIAAAAFAGEASAQEGKALAEALFRDGRALLAAGKTGEACAKFAMSHRIEPKLGTLLNLASCQEAEGKTASAWAHFTEASSIASRTDQHERAQFAGKRAEALSKRLSRLTITSAEATEIAVRIDGLIVDAAVVGTEFPVDPGEHTVTVTAAGKKPWTTTISVPEGPSLTPVNVPALVAETSAEPETPEPPVVTTPVPPPTRTSSAPPPPRPVPDRPASTRTAGWFVLGAGAVGVGLGTFLGLRAFDLQSDGELHCESAGGARACNAEGDELLNASEASAHASTVSFAVGLAAVAVGVYLIVRSPATVGSPPVRSVRAPSGLLPGPRGVSVAW